MGHPGDPPQQQLEMNASSVALQITGHDTAHNEVPNSIMHRPGAEGDLDNTHGRSKPLLHRGKDHNGGKSDCLGSNPQLLRPLTRVAVNLRRAPSPLSMALLNARSVANKSFLLNDLIDSRNVDLLFLTETWQRNSDHSSLIELCPAGYSFIGRPRPSGRGGGIAAVFRNRLLCRSNLLHWTEDVQDGSQ
ncbi:uncharacterized protein LOC144987877 isoform X2 [Oryzias latipes]